MKGSWVCALVVAIALVVSGCNRKNRASSVASNPAPIVEVIDDAAQIADARKAFEKDQERTFAHALENPFAIYPLDDEVMGILKARREAAVQSLKKTRDDSAADAERRIGAIRALEALDVEPDTNQLVSIASASPKARQQLLIYLDNIYPKKTPPPPPVRALVIAAIDSADPIDRRQAGHLVGLYPIPEAVDPLLNRLRSDANAEPALLGAAAKLRPGAEVLDIIVKRLRSAGEMDRYWTLAALCELAKTTPDPQVKRAATEACVAHLKTVPNGPSIGTELDALRVIGTTSPVQDAKDMLVDLVRTAKHKLIRQYALEELARLDKGGAKALSVLSGIKIPADEKPQPSAADKLTPQQAAEICVRHRVLSKDQADSALIKLKEKSASRKRTPADASGSVAAYTSNPTAKDEEGEDSDSGSAVPALLDAAGRFIAFDVETSTLPNRHDRLLLDLAKSSAGQFKPEAPLETFTPDKPDAETGKYVVQFIHAGKLYRFYPRDLGDWYDVAAVLAAVNRACADAGLAERFTSLEAEGQIAPLVFADPRALKEAAVELGLKLSSNPDQARKLGKEYEDQVLEKLEKK